jgi:acyl-CoA synthetase (AMP-forming)/AMP-acid ligase II
MLTPLPTSHMNAMACSTMCMLMTGGCLIALDRFHASTWWESVREARATIVHYLGVMPAMLLGAPPSPKDREHEVRFGFGAGVNPRHHADFEKRFGFPLLEAWAMTETGAGGVIIANREPRHVGTACFGKAEPAVEYRLIDDAGEDVPTGTPGELLVRTRGSNPRFGFFAGYLKDEAATEEAWKGGYFHTGDVVRADAEGNMYFVDRKKNVIRRSGENISAVEVESALIRHPGIRAVGVAAVPDAVRGDEVMACIVSKEPVAAHERAKRAEEIVRFALANIAYYKVPGYVTFCERLPLTPTEKIQRAELKKLAAQSLDGGDAIDTRALKKREHAA